MPQCRKCERVAATAEMRRSPRPGEWLCKDVGPCQAAARALRAARKEEEHIVAKVNLTTVATSRYFHTRLIQESGLVPLATTVGNPKGRLPYELGGSVQPVAPHGAFSITDEAEFRRVYLARLDAFGVPAIAEIFSAFAHAYRSEGVIVLCFCDLTKPGFCHRRVFAEWWYGQTGITVPELGDHQ